MTSAYLTRQLDRWTRPNAHLFVRPDWRRFAPRADAEHPFARYEQKYRPDQPRVPAGSREGGQWASGGEGGGGEAEDGGGAGSPEEETTPERTRVAGTVIPICTVGSRTIYGDGSWKIVYDCPDGSTITRTGTRGRIPGFVIYR